MARIFITGSTDGLGRAAARALLDAGHKVVLHARTADRAATLAEFAGEAAGVAVGDLRSAVEVRGVALHDRDHRGDEGPRDRRPGAAMPGQRPPRSSTACRR